jgi:hypothetical protein
MADVPSASAEPALTVAQVVWWILTRDETSLDLREHSSLPDLRRAFLANQFEAAISGLPCHQGVAEVAEFLRDEPKYRSEVQDLKEELRKNYWPYVLPKSREEIDRRLSEFGALVPGADPNILRMALSTISAEFHLRHEFFRALRDLLRQLARGSVSATGRRNRRHDRTKIDATVWPDYQFDLEDISRMGMVLAIPRDPKQLELAWKRTVDPTLAVQGGEASIWADVRLNAVEVRTVWPLEQTLEAPAVGATKKRRTISQIDDKHRDGHSIVAAAMRRKWPGAKHPPSLNRMAKELADDPVIKARGYKPETLRKILDGTYPPFRRLGLPALSVGTRTNSGPVRTSRKRIPT